MINYFVTIDTTGLRCPLPVLKVQKNIKPIKKNEIALIITDDPMAEIDLKHFCNLKNYTIKNVSKNYADKRQYYEIRY